MAENSNKKVVQTIAVRPVNVCPKCGNKIFHVVNPNYCGHCGQELEWPGEWPLFLTKTMNLRAEGENDG